MPDEPLLKMISVRQTFPDTADIDVTSAVHRIAEAHFGSLKPGARIAVTAGSRGIAEIDRIIRSTVTALKAAGAEPFIVPAMGSHGGATPDGQRALLAEYGISESEVGAPIHCEMETTPLPTSTGEPAIPFSVRALDSDGIIVVNRIKPHTDFAGKLGSGIVKMLVVGLGKQSGAARFHSVAVRLGYEAVLRSTVDTVLKSAPVLGGIGIVENQRHRVARLEWLPADSLVSREETLFREALHFMPHLPLEVIDLLIVDRMGKNISGAGMDTNVIGRGVHGYSSFIGKPRETSPLVHRIFVRDLTSETRGNAIGIGLADLTTDRLVQQIDRRATYLNALTANTPHGAKIPIHFASDREAIARALGTLTPDFHRARVVRIRDTLSLENIQVSTACEAEILRNASLKVTEPAAPMTFDELGNLAS